VRSSGQINRRERVDLRASWCSTCLICYFYPSLSYLYFKSQRKKKPSRGSKKTQVAPVALLVFDRNISEALTGKVQHRPECFHCFALRVISSVPARASTNVLNRLRRFFTAGKLWKLRRLKFVCLGPELIREAEQRTINGVNFYPSRYD
jgi:hypothetical protein